MRRRQALGSILAGCGAALASSVRTADGMQRVGPGSVPMTGLAGPGLGRFDELISDILTRHRVRGASLAIARGGRLVLARGYGLADVEARAPVRPGSLFALASVSKCLTAVTLWKLLERGKLTLDAPVFEVLGHVRPLPGARVDPRLRRITVRQCLNHSGGWDRDRSGDPAGFTGRVTQALRLGRLPTAGELTRYMLGRPLDFDPGTQIHYSNFGYALLGLVIEHLAGVPYARAVEEVTLRPMGVDHVTPTPAPPQYLPNEVRRYEGTSPRALPGGDAPMMLASGGWAGSAVDLVRFLTALDGTRIPAFLSEATMRRMTDPPPSRYPTGIYCYTLGWTIMKETPKGRCYGKLGDLSGLHTYVEHTAPDVDWAIFINSSEPKSPRPPHTGSGDIPATTELRNALRKTINAVKDWPDVDYFERIT